MPILKWIHTPTASEDEQADALAAMTERAVKAEDVIASTIRFAYDVPLFDPDS